MRDLEDKTLGCFNYLFDERPKIRERYVSTDLVPCPVGEGAYSEWAPLIIIAVVLLGFVGGSFVVAFTMAAGMEAYSRLRGEDQGRPGYRAILSGAWGRLWP